MFSLSEIGLRSPLIHIGYHKALSSWMQTHLFLSDCGFVTIMGPLAVRLEIIDPTAFAFEPDKIAEYLKRTITDHDLSESHIPVITSEGLSGNQFCGGYNAKELADRLRLIFADGRILIIVREQRAMIRSLYTSLISWGMPHTIQRFLNPVSWRRSPQFNYAYLEYHQLVAYYQQAFGESNILVLPYELFCEDPHRYIRAIHGFSGNTHDLNTISDRLPYDERVNPSRTLVNLKFQRLLNALFVSNNFNYSGLFRDSDKATMRRLRACRRRDRRVPRFMANWFEKGFKEYVENETRGRFIESNRKLSELTGIDLERYGYEV